jgi:K+-transporting ATPase c subunit
VKSSVSEFLEHYGKKGMRWGTRKGRAGASRSTDRTVFNKSPKKLTSAELDSRIKRMEMEKRYNELNKRDVSKGQQLASEVLSNSGRTVATTVLTGAAILGVRALAKKKGVSSEAVNILTKRK